MKLTIEIELGNDGMQTVDDAKEAVLDAFNHYAGWSSTQDPRLLHETRIADDNGNTVGHITVED